MFFIPRALLQQIRKLKLIGKANKEKEHGEANSYNSESESSDEENASKGESVAARDEIPADYYINLKYYPNANVVLVAYLKFATWCKFIVSQDWFNYFVLIIIIIAGLLVGIETYPSMAANPVMPILDEGVLGVFILEMMLKIFGEGLRPDHYFTNSEWKWNWFDCTIVILSLPFWGSLFGGGSIKMLRLIRLTRLGKIVRRIPPLQMIIRGL